VLVYVALGLALKLDEIDLLRAAARDGLRRLFQG
jgi:hypothetical protein